MGGTVKERRTEITIETYEVLIRSRQGAPGRWWCAICDKQVATIRLDDAYNSDMDIEAVQRQVETGRIHLIETNGGSSLICLNSLIECERRQT